MTTSVNQLPKRLRSKIEVDEKTGCWMWIAGKDPQGYGRCYAGPGIGPRFAHRVVFQILDHDPVGLVLDHLCRVPSCVNPEHLEPVTNGENLRRGIGPQLAKQRYANHLWCPKGHPLFGPNLYSNTTPQGYTKKHCRTCKAEHDRARKAATRAARAES